MPHQVFKQAVGALIVSTATSRVLLSLRAPHKTHAMQWSLFGGMMEINEHPKEALLREFSEEMNFIPDIEKIYSFDIYTSADKQFRYYSFLCIVTDEFVPDLNNENCGYCWVDLACWPKPMHIGARNSFCNEKAEDRIKTLLSQHTQSSA